MEKLWSEKVYTGDEDPLTNRKERTRAPPISMHHSTCVREDLGRPADLIVQSQTVDQIWGKSSGFHAIQFFDGCGCFFPDKPCGKTDGVDAIALLFNNPHNSFELIANNKGIWEYENTGTAWGGPFGSYQSLKSYESYWPHGGYLLVCGTKAALPDPTSQYTLYSGLCWSQNRLQGQRVVA